MGAGHVHWGLQLFGGLNKKLQERTPDKLKATDMIQNRIRVSEQMKKDGKEWQDRSSHVVKWLFSTARGTFCVLLGAYKFLYCMRSKTGARWGDIPGNTYLEKAAHVKKKCGHKALCNVLMAMVSELAVVYKDLVGIGRHPWFANVQGQYYIINYLYTSVLCLS